MEKRIIATNLDGFLIKHSAFFEPHKAWFARAIEKTGNKDLEKWIGKKDYFIGVDEAMTLIMPEASKEEKRKQAREGYQEDVVKYIKEHPEVVNKEVADFLRSLKENAQLVLITTSAQDYSSRILEAARLSDIYDKVYGTDLEKVPSKGDVFKKMIEDIGKPAVYIGGRVRETYELCKELGIKTLYANFEDFEPIDGVETVKNLNELKSKV